MRAFAELCAATNFSFLRAAAHPEEMVAEAKRLGLAAIGVADRNTLAGIVRAHAAAKAEGLRLAVGARLAFQDTSAELVVFPQDRRAYGRLTRLLTLGNRRAPKGECHLKLADFLAHAEGLRPIVCPSFTPGAAPEIGELMRTLRQACGPVRLAARVAFDGEDKRRLRLFQNLAHETGARLLATTEPLHHVPERRALLDVLTCVYEKTTLDAAGRRLALNAERHLKPPDEIARLYQTAPDAVAESLRLLEELRFSLDDLSYQYPEETVDGFPTAQAALEAKTWEGARRRYPHGLPERVEASLRRELDIVAALKYAPYFLTVADIVRYAREERGILCQGRGSAANSAICYCLGITEVDPGRFKLLFDRFISAERGEPPDIDVDFEHERREEALQYVYEKYGRSRAALAATLICYRGRSAIRDVCKAFGFSEDRISALSKTQQWWSKSVTADDLRGLGLDVSDGTLMTALTLVHELKGFPRHLSQHVGGFVVTRDQLDEISPIQNAAMKDRTVVEWDKDDLEELKILKVDLLGLGMLSCLRKAFDLVNAHYPDWTAKAARDDPDGPPSSACVPLTLETLPKEDARVYAMLRRADSIGVFQVESRAQMSMLPRLRPECFYDLVIEVAIVRPGPIQGGMVHPYLRRKQGLEPVTYPSKALEEVLKRTLGVPLFQEQAMEIAIVAAGFSPPEADKLRRAMATFRRVGTIQQLKAKFIDGMIANGYARDFAEASFAQIEGFGEYGFPESHAASFALLVYASSWLKCHYPDVFAAALLNAQPMGFYAPSEIVRDAIEHGVEAREPDVNFSDWDNTLEPLEEDGRKPLRLSPRHVEQAGDIRTTRALRLGFRQILGLKEEELRRLVERRGQGYDSVRDVWLRAEISPATIERLADADAFRSLGLDRREALWFARGLNRVGGQEDLPLFSRTPDPTQEADFALPSMPLGEHVVEDYRAIGLSLKAHPTGLLREHLSQRGVTRAEDLAKIGNGRRTRVAGLVLVRQRPGTASGVIFMTLQDETHVANIVVWPAVFERFRAVVLGSRLCAVDGLVQIERGVVHVIADRLYDYSPLLAKLSNEDLAPRPANADEVKTPRQNTRVPKETRYAFLQNAARHPRDVRHDLWNAGEDPGDAERAADVMPKGRNFH